MSTLDGPPEPAPPSSWTLRLQGDWTIGDGRRGAEVMARVCAAFGGGRLRRVATKNLEPRVWSETWSSPEGASLAVSASPLGATDAQCYEFALRLPDGIEVGFDLVDTCGTSEMVFTISGDADAPLRLEPVLREAFAGADFRY